MIYAQKKLETDLLFFHKGWYRTILGLEALTIYLTFGLFKPFVAQV
jgi:hypothetical protein